jgi:outer membrane receptor protein involved in Fe transport
MIKRLPGFTFDDGATARGFAGTASNVLIDGQRPTSKTDDVQSILTRLPADDVERIEVIRGGAPGIDMHGQTVVANVIRKKGNTTHVALMAEDNLFKDGHNVPGASIQVTRHEGASTYDAALSMFENYDDSVGRGSHNIYDASGATLVHNDVLTHAASNGYQFNGSAAVPLWDGQFKANLTLQNSPFRDSTLYTSPGFREFFDDDNVNRNGELGLHWTADIGKINIETLGLERIAHTAEISTDNSPVTDELFRLIADTGESIVRTTARYLPTSDLTIEGGAEAAFNYLIGKTGFIDNGVLVPVPSARARVQEHRAEAFVQSTWKISSDLLLETGIRFETSTISETGETNQSRSFFYPKPRAVLTWTIDPEQQFRVRYEKVVGQLNFNNFIASANLTTTGVSAGNANLKPDQHDQYEASYERHFWDKGSFVVTYLHEDIKDVVDYIPVASPVGFFDAPGNIGDGTNDQLDVEVHLPLDNLGLPNGLLKSSTIFRWSDVRDPETGVQRVISGERPQAINVGLTQDIASLNSTWGIDYFNCWDEYYYRLALIQHRKVIPPYMDVYWEYKPTSDWSLHLELDNIVPFIFDQKQFFYTGPRATNPLDTIEELRVQSQPRVFFQIRKTFD